MRVAWRLALVVLIGGCGDDARGGGPECELHSDCAAGMYCQSGECGQDCVSSADCEMSVGPGATCNPIGRCVAGTADAGRDAGRGTDGGAMDAGPMDAGSADAGSIDSGPLMIDAGPLPIDAGPPDAGPRPMDAGPPDAGPRPRDAGPPDSGPRDAGPTVPRPTAGALVITEVMSNPATTTDPAGEWFEITNPSATVTYDLTGCTIHDNVGMSRLGALAIAPRDSLVFANSAVAGVVPDHVYGGALALANTADLIHLDCDGAEIDRVAWTAAGVFTASGRAANLSPAFTDAVSNDDAMRWCAATTMYAAMDYGTPGASNTACP